MIRRQNKNPLHTLSPTSEELSIALYPLFIYYENPWSLISMLRTRFADIKMQQIYYTPFYIWTGCLC